MTGKIPGSSQFLFYLMPEEIGSLLAFIHEQDCYIFNSRSTINRPTEWDTLSNDSHLFITPRDLLPTIHMQKIGEATYFVDATVSPVIELSCSVLYRNRLIRGRVYFRGGYDGRDGWVAYPEKLYELNKKVLNYMKKMFLTKERVLGGYVSKGAQIHVASGGELVQ